MSGADLVQPVQELLAALTASTAAAGGAAGIQERGGTAAAPRAWAGDGSEETKKRLKASIVRLKSGRFGYIPASSGASILKTWAATAASDAVSKLKLSDDGGESGRFLTVDEANALIDRVWLGCITVGADGGSQASSLVAGGVAGTISPVVGSDGTLTQLVATMAGGVTSPANAIADVAVAFGYPIEEWLPWEGRAAVPGAATVAAGLPGIAVATAWGIRLEGVGLGGNGCLALLQAMLVEADGQGVAQAGKLGTLIAALAGRGHDAPAVACCLTAEAVPVPADALEAANLEAAKKAGQAVIAAFIPIIPGITMGMVQAAEAAEASLRLLGQGGVVGIGLSLRAQIVAGPTPPATPPRGGGGAGGGGAGMAPPSGTPLPLPGGVYIDTRPDLVQPGLGPQPTGGAGAVGPLHAFVPVGVVCTTALEIVGCLGGADRLGPMLARANSGRVHDEVMWPWASPAAIGYMAIDLAAIAAAAIGAGYVFGDPPTSWDDSRAILLAVVSAAAAAAAAPPPPTQSGRKDGYFTVKLATKAHDIEGAASASMLQPLAKNALVEAERARIMPPTWQEGALQVTAGLPRGEGWAAVFSSQTSITTMADEGKISATYHALHTCAIEWTTDELVDKAVSMHRKVSARALTSEAAMRLVTLRLEGSVEAFVHLLGGVPPSRVAGSGHNRDRIGALREGTWGKVKGATAPYDIERAMRVLEPILVGLHGRPGGASPHTGTFGLERMAAEMARYVAAGEMRIEHMVDLINILFAEISRLACLKRERRDMPDIDFAAITEVVASEDLEAKLSKVRLDKAAAESARHELSKRSRPGLSGAGGGDDGDGEPGRHPPALQDRQAQGGQGGG